MLDKNMNLYDLPQVITVQDKDRILRIDSSRLPRQTNQDVYGLAKSLRQPQSLVDEGIEHIIKSEWCSYSFHVNGHPRRGRLEKLGRIVKFLSSNKEQNLDKTREYFDICLKTHYALDRRGVMLILGSISLPDIDKKFERQILREEGVTNFSISAVGDSIRGSYRIVVNKVDHSLIYEIKDAVMMERYLSLETPHVNAVSKGYVVDGKMGVFEPDFTPQNINHIVSKGYVVDGKMGVFEPDFTPQNINHIVEQSLTSWTRSLYLIDGSIFYSEGDSDLTMAPFPWRARELLVASGYEISYFFVTDIHGVCHVICLPLGNFEAGQVTDVTPDWPLNLTVPQVRLMLRVKAAR